MKRTDVMVNRIGKLEIPDSRQFDSRHLAPKESHETRIAFVQPRIPDGNYLPNLGIMYMASILIRAGYQVRVLDENIHGDVLGELVSFQPNAVGFTCVTAAVESSARLAQAIRQFLPNARIVFGGPHVTAVPVETLTRYGVVDFGIVGEGERSFLQFSDACVRDGSSEPEVLGSIPGLVWRKPDGEVVNNGPAPLLTNEELDTLPFPAWHLLPMEPIFKKATHGLFTKGKRIMPIMTARGCPHFCGFCCRIAGFDLREHSIPRVISEILWLVETYAIDELYFEDDTFTEKPDRAHAILDAIIELNLPIHVKFANGLRADRVDENLLGKMKLAGVYWVGFGIESGSPHTQKLMRKFLDLDQAAKNVRLAKRLGFKVGSNCIIGYPGETRQSIRESIRYFQHLELDSFAVVTCVPFPATTARQVCEENGWLTDRARNYENYWFEVFKVSPLIETPFLSADDLRRAILWVYIRFYFMNLKRFLTVMRLLLRKHVPSVLMGTDSAGTALSKALRERESSGRTGAPREDTRERNRTKALPYGQRPGDAQFDATGRTLEIRPGCIVCRACEAVAPRNFAVREGRWTAEVLKATPSSEEIQGVLRAVRICPEGVIGFRRIRVPDKVPTSSLPKPTPE